MTFYCDNCKIVFESNENKCNICGKKKLKEPSDGDPVFLAAHHNGPLSGMLENILKENKIPFSRLESQGSFMAVFGHAFSFNYYVPYAAYKKAKELEALIFS